MKMKALLVGFVGLAAVSAQALVIGGGQNATQSFSTNLLSESVTVGLVSPDNSLTIMPFVTFQHGNATVGEEATAINNDWVLRAFSTNIVVGDFVVGRIGSENSLTVQTGAVVYANNLVLGNEAVAVMNTATNDGGRVLIQGQIVVGNAGSSNRMDVLNGGYVAGDEGYVGGFEGAASNTLYVAGTDSTVFMNSLQVGSISNFGNRVVVTNGGEFILNDLVIEGTNSFELNEGGTLTTYSTNFDASASGFVWNSGGTLNAYGELTGVSTLESNKTLAVFGDWNEAGTVTVGGTTSDNELTISGAGRATLGALEVGGGSNAVGNIVRVNGGGELATDSLTVGSALSSNNTVTVSGGGLISVSNSFGLVINSNNTFTIGNGGQLTVSDFDAGQDGFEFGAGGTLEATGTLDGMTNSLSGGQQVLLTGIDAEWDVGANPLQLDGSSISLSGGAELSSSNAVLVSGSRVDVNGSTWNNTGGITLDSGGGNMISVTNAGTVITDSLGMGSGNRIELSDTGSIFSVTGSLGIGDAGSGNALEISNGAKVLSASATVGGAGGNNLVVIRGASAWENTGDFSLVGMGNRVMLTNNAALEVDGSLALTDGGTLQVKSDSVVEAGDYSQDGQSVLEFDSVTVGTAVIDVAGTATFETNATIRFAGAAGDVAVGVTNSRDIVTSTTLDADLASLNVEALNGLFLFNLSDAGNTLTMDLVRQALAEYAGFETNSQMYEIANFIDVESTNNNPVAANQLEVIGAMSDGAEANAQLTQLYERSAPTFMHMEGLFEGMRQVQNRGIVPDTYWPVGVGGPHYPGDQAQLWFKGFGSWGQQDADGSYSAYDQSVYGVVIGVDKSYGDFLAGLAGGYSQSVIDQDDGDESESGMGYGVLYGSYGSKSWFGDLSLAYGMGSVENKTGTDFDTTSDFDASQFGFYLGGGKEMVFKLDTVFVTPTLAVLGGNWSQDSYKEESSNALAKRVEDYSRWSFKSELGVETAFRKDLRNSILMPEVHAKWLHEFNTDEDSVGYTLDGSTGNYSFGMAAPVSDLFEVGAAVSLWAENKQDVVYEYVLGFDARFGSGYMASIVNARVNIEF